MESMVGEVWSSSQDGSNLLGLPGPCPWDDDDEPLGLGGIKPKSSPIPRRRSSASSCSDDDLQPPMSSSRRVSFADAFGLSLVSVKQFDSWAMCGSSDPLEGDLTEAKEYFLSQLFSVPTTREELIQKVQQHNLELESLELLPGTTTLKGVIRVLNLCFDKLVYIRTSLDCWRSHFDLLAEYVPRSSDGNTDSFSFRLTLVPPFGEKGIRVDFCLRYETPFGNFWANNSGQNYVLFCHEKAKEQVENEKKHKRKSCLKSTSLDYSLETSSTSSTEEVPDIIMSSEVAAVHEAVAVNEEKTQELIELQEENNRNLNRRSRRKAARLEKIRQHFAKYGEKGDQQIENETGEVGVIMNMENAVPERVEAPFNLTKLQTNASAELLLPSPSEPEEIKKHKCPACSVDADSEQVSAKQIHIEDQENIPVMHSELTTSISQATLSPVDSESSTVGSVLQALDSSQNKETLAGQTLLITQQQISEPSLSKTVEKAWECFEKGAKVRIGSTMDRRMGEDKTTSACKEIRNNVNLENPEPFGCNFTFETIVAPLYHQVFEIMEMEKRDLMDREFSAERSAGKLQDGYVSAVTYQNYPRTQSVETRPIECRSEKHVVNDVHHEACKEPFVPDLFNTNTMEESLSGTNVNTKLVEISTTSSTDIMDDPRESLISESKLAATTQRQHLANSLQLKCVSLSLEDGIPDQKETPQDRGKFKQSQFMLESTLEDIHDRTPYNTCFQIEHSRENGQHEHVPVDYMVLTTQSELNSLTGKTSDTIFSENPSSTDTTEITTTQSKDAKVQQPQTPDEPQASMESTFTEIPPSSKCMEESHRPIPDTSLFYAHISSNVIPNFSQSQAPTSSQNLTPIQIQSPDLNSFKHSQKTPGITFVQFQITEGTKLTQGSDSLPHYTDLLRMESHSARNYETGSLERPAINSVERTLDKTLHVSQIHQSKASTVPDFTSPGGSNGPLDKDKVANSKNNSNTDSAEKEADIHKEDEWVENTDINNKQESTDKEHQSWQVSEEAMKTKETKVQEGEEDKEEEQEQEEGNKGQETDQKQAAPEQQERDKVNKEKRELQEEEHKDEPEEQQKQQEEEELEKKKETEEEIKEKGEQGQQQQQQQGQGEEAKELGQERAAHEQEEEEHQQKEDKEKQEQELGEEDKKGGDQKHEELEKEMKEKKKEEQQPVNDNIFEDRLLYIDDDEEETVKDMRANDIEQYVDKWEIKTDHLSLEVETEEQEKISRDGSLASVESTTNVDCLENQVQLHVNQEQQSTGRTSQGCSVGGEAEISWGMDLFHQASTGNSITTLSDRVGSIQSCLNKKNEGVGDTTAELNRSSENPEDRSEQGEKNMDDSASTESLTDDEMELYLHRLKSTNQPGIKETASNGNYSKRSSVSRTRTMSSPMPSISESVDEDQPNASLENLTNEDRTELERSTLSLEEEKKEIIRRNMLWWREFFSSDNMSKVITYTFLFFVFLITAYFCDFIACFGLYLLALYWIYFRRESEPLKVTQPER